MQIMTAKQAKNNFGEMTNAMLREPVFITKNNRPIGAFVSMEDLKNTPIAERYANEHDDWVFEQLSQSLETLEKNGSQGIPATDDFYQQAMAKVKDRLAQKV